jgi:redox-sensing transcriptional repressor
MHVNRIAEFVTQNSVDIAVVTVPRTYAKDVADLVTGLGIKGIWNFTSVKLAVPEDVAVENIHLSDSLMTLGYYMKEMKDNRK